LIDKREVEEKEGPGSEITRCPFCLEHYQAEKQAKKFFACHFRICHKRGCPPDAVWQHSAGI
jgi:hypothetical protein